MGRTFQSVALFDDMTVLDNVLVGLHATMRAGTVASALRPPRHCNDERRAREAAAALLARFGLTEHAGVPATSLPHGLQRKVELARALAASPALLLLDEPLAGLAEDEAEATGRTIRELADTGTAVLLAEGPPARIQTDARVVEAYVGTC